MSNRIALNKIDKTLLAFSSCFLIITSLISIWFVFIIINIDLKLEFLIILVLIISMFIIGLTLWTNSVILSKKEVLRKREININLIICLIQSVSIFMNGFRFKYLQGLECVFYINIDQTISKVESGIVLPKLGFQFVFNFMSTKGIFIGINVIALIFSFFFLYIRGKYFHNKESVLT